MNSTSTTQGSPKSAVIKIVFITCLIGALFLLFFNHISRVNMKAHENQRLIQLKQLVQIALNTIEPVLEEYRSGRQTREKTIQDVRDLLRRMIFHEEHGNNYIFMSTYNGIMLVQPFEPYKEMKNQWDLQDSNGVYIIRELIGIAKKEKDGGYLMYHYTPPGKNRSEEKISYVKGIAELECYIGTGRYMGDFRQKQTSFKWKIVSLELILLFLLLVLIFNVMNEILSHNRKLQEEVEKRKQSDADLRESERRLNTLMGNLPGMAYRCMNDEKRTMEYVSDVCLPLTGYQQGDLIENRNISYRDLIYSDDLESVYQEIQKGVAKQKPYTITYRIRTISGEIKWIWEHGIGVYSGDDLLSLEGMVMDITQRKLTEEALQASEGRYRTLVANIPGVTYRCACDKSWTMEFLSKEISIISGYPVSDFLQNQVSFHSSIIHPDDKQMLEDTVMQSVRQKKIFTMEYRIMHADGGLRWVFEKGQGIFDDDGTLLCLDGVIVDITDRKLAEEALQESETHMRTLVETIPDIVWLKDPDGLYLSCNPKFERFLGAKEADIIGKTDYDFVDRELADFFREKDKAAMAANRSTINEEEIVYADDGHRELIETIKTPLYHNDGKLIGVLGIARDITKRKQVEKDLKKAQSYIFNIINSMPSVLVGVDINGRVTHWNTTAEQTTGVAARAAHGKTFSNMFPHMASETEKITESILSRKIKHEQRRPRQYEGDTRYEDVTIYPLIANNVEGAVIRIDDVTEKVCMEEMMIQSEKMLSIGGLAAGMAHEINNPLAGIMQIANVLANRLDENKKIPANLKAAEAAGTTMETIQDFMRTRGIIRMISTIKESCQRVTGIINNMLSFARKGETSTSSHDLSELLDKTLELAATDYDLKKEYDFKMIGIKKEYDTNLPSVTCEGSKIQQVLLNILRNGGQAMQEAGTVNPCFILRTKFDDSRKMISVEIEDNGPGMDESIRKRVFEPFYTSKPVGVGTGLGLSVSYFIITENHGGEMSVESQPGTGAKFIINLPLEAK